MQEGTNTTCHVEPVRLAKAVILAIACFGVGLFVGTRMPADPLQSTSNKGDFAAGFEAARAKLIKGGYIQDPASMPVTTVSGVVKAASANSLSVSRLPLDILDDSRDVTVTVSPDTEVVLLSAKDPAVYASEVEAYNRASSEPGSNETGGPANTLPYPSDRVRTPTTLANIPQGSAVTVYANETITPDTSSISARAIEVAEPARYTPEVISTPEPATVPDTAEPQASESSE